MQSKLTLDMQDWVPIGVQEEAVRILVRLRSTVPSDEVSRSFAVLRGLATAECMKRVWSTLKRHKHQDRKVTEEYEHSPIYSSELASRLGIDPHDRTRIQEAAMCALFVGAFELATLPLLIRKRGNIAPRDLLYFAGDIDRYADIEVDLEHLAKISGVEPPIPSTLNKLFGETAMKIIADSVRDSNLGRWHVVLCRREVVLMVHRKVDDARARCVGIGVAAVCKDLFGTELYGTSANIAKAATGKEINLAKVRQWCSEVERETQNMGTSDGAMD